MKPLGRDGHLNVAWVLYLGTPHLVKCSDALAALETFKVLLYWTLSFILADFNECICGYEFQGCRRGKLQILAHVYAKKYCRCIRCGAKSRAGYRYRVRGHADLHILTETHFSRAAISHSIARFKKQLKAATSLETSANGDCGKMLSPSRLHDRMDMRPSTGDDRSSGNAGWKTLRSTSQINRQ